MKDYLKAKEEVLEEVNSSNNGLNNQDAILRLQKNGKNKLSEGKKESAFKSLLRQFSDPMIIILIIAAFISLITSIYANESFADAFIILFVVLINAFLGMYQEKKAEKAIDALKEMSTSVSKVIRNGKLSQIKSEDIVIGDIIVLEAGDAVAADARVIESIDLKVDEAALTGESLPVDKIDDILSLDSGMESIPLGDRKNMVYMGSNVVFGKAKAVVVSTGMDTQMGKIADAIVQAKNNLTPLQKKLNQLSKILSFIVIFICIFLFIFSIFTKGQYDSKTLIDTFMLAVSLAVAAIPEGLAAVVTVQLSIGVTRMAKHNAIIRKLTAVETLGCTQVICSDKTGTLTKNQMTVVDFFTKSKEKLALAMGLCNDATLDEHGKVLGEPTETALFKWSHSIESFDELKKKLTRVAEIPFDSGRKMMSTFYKESDGQIIQYTKGAPDIVLSKCNRYFDGNDIVEMTDGIRKEILKKNKDMADKALRVLCAAIKKYDTIPKSPKSDPFEENLIFIGLCGLIDPIRDEAKEAIKRCKESGIKPIMITGDHINTAVAIGTSLGIINDRSESLTGLELDKISDERLLDVIDKYAVFARVQPEHKTRIVNAYKEKGIIVAMTGDGVNDAPSIKSADIGIGMGITGTDVTKNVADMILADDNFSTIVYAVSEGRRIYDNIRKAIQFLLSSNISEVISIFVATVLGFTILYPVHILWINLITDTLPALALGMERAEPKLMKQKPRPSNESVFSDRMGFDIFYQGLLISILTLASYFIGSYFETGDFKILDSSHGITMAFLTMSMAEIFHSFNVRSRKESIFKLKYQNLYLWGSMLLSFILTFIVIYIPLFVQMFSFEHISAIEYTTAIIVAILVIPIVELVKLIQKEIVKNRN